MLAQIDLKRGQQDEARAALQALVSDEQVLEKMPSAACWVIGQLLDEQ